MDVYDTAHSVTEDGNSSCDEVITRKIIYKRKRSIVSNWFHVSFSGVVTDLFSYDDVKRTRILDHYYLPNSTFVSPILRTSGVHNIKQ